MRGSRQKTETKSKTAKENRDALVQNSERTGPPNAFWGGTACVKFSSRNRTRARGWVGRELLNGRPVRVLCEENVLEEAAVCETLTESDMTPPREIDTRREEMYAARFEKTRQAVEAL